MVGASTLGIESEAALARLPHQQLVAELQLVELRGEFAFGDKLEEKFDLIFIRRRDDRIRTLGTLFRSLHAECGVLSGGKLELAAGLDANHPEVRGKVHALGNLRMVKLVIRSAHRRTRCTVDRKRFLKF